MAVDLRDTNIDPTRPEYRKMLENLQANILKPHGRKESDHLVVRFAAGPETVRGWIREFARREVTSAQKQLDETGTYHDHGTRGGLVASLALSAKGYEALGLLPEDFGDSGQAFRNGMKRRVFSLLARNRDPLPGEWEAPYQGDIHALVSLSHDSDKDLAAKTREVSEGLRPIAEILTVDRGTLLRNARGDPIEHFGYVDARSQPLFLQADLDAEKTAGVDAWDPSAPLGLVLVDDPFTSDEDCFGSYLVFRKLQQDVVNFNAGVKDLATRLAVDEARAGALVVGRFKDGTPVTLRPWDGLGPVNKLRVPRARPRRESMSVPRAHPEGESARGEPVLEFRGRTQPSDRAPRHPLWSPRGPVQRSFGSWAGGWRARPAVPGVPRRYRPAVRVHSAHLGRQPELPGALPVPGFEHGG
jgi:deferrochelatase/peroxidase EfeB